MWNKYGMGVEWEWNGCGMVDTQGGDGVRDGG